MTIIAQLNTLSEAYAGIEALRSRSIPPDLTKKGDYLVISVDDDFAESARAILRTDGHFSDEYLRTDGNQTVRGLDEFNA